ncbi:hypothetical protein TRFO_10646 [Tritrichomonas foetus]|uniref:Leucine Rich Repeat family protein n=1 Tax=Tritrichomonas foetus TaxID=1144522 RepID=A0A1J4JBY2_9EUKA|nr:hypothetical protein TRFO_10646 [Tritrichomonas foetus]|eukprot:OHS95163.1 hypothetical protein TRFO_10646 [Tritrichomonas foetus]
MISVAGSHYTTSRSISAKKCQRVAVNAVHQKVDSFEKLNFAKNCSTIDLSKNRLRNFSGLPSLRLLTHLTINDNPLFSFYGATPQPSLFWVSFKNTPLSKHTHFRLMCLIVFGSKLTFINDEPVSKNLIQKADKLRESVLPELLEGNILISLSPIKFVVPQEKRSCTATFTTIVPGAAPSNVEGEDDEQSQVVQPPQPSIATICERILEENNISFLEPERLEGIRSKLRDMREHFQMFDEEEEEEFQNEEHHDSFNEFGETISIDAKNPMRNPSNSKNSAQGENEEIKIEEEEEEYVEE